MKDKGRRDYTLNPTSRGPTNRVQFNLLCQFLSAHSRGIITLILGDDRSAIISLLWASCLEVPKPDLDPQFGTRNRFTTRDSDCSPVAHHFLEVA